MKKTKKPKINAIDVCQGFMVAKDVIMKKIDVVDALEFEIRLDSCHKEYIKIIKDYVTLDFTKEEI